MSLLGEQPNELVARRCVSAKIIPLLFNSQLSDSVRLSLVSRSPELEDLHTFPQSTAKLYRTSEFKGYTVLSHSDYVWEATEDDGGTYTVLSPEVDSKVKQAQQSYMAGQNLCIPQQFVHNGKVLTVNFKTFQLSEQNSPSSRHIRHSPPFWCYHVPQDGVYIRHEARESALIEEIYRYGGDYVPMGGTQYMFMFSTEKSYQVDAKTLEMVEIQRYPPITSNPCEIQIQLDIRGNPDSVSLIARQLNELSQYRQELKFTFQADEKTKQILAHHIANVTRGYCVGATHNLTGNEVTTVICGVESYVDKLSLLLHDLNSQLQLKISSLAIRDMPEDWEPQTTQCELKVVSDSREWTEVLRKMRETMKSVEILKLERVQNQPLWEKYALEKRQMHKRNNGAVNEKFLFHGTRKAIPENIALDIKGVDFRFSRSERLMWGTGAYFAVNASYSDTFAHQMQDGLKQMILVRVLTGNSCSFGTKKQETLTKPPPLQQSPSCSARLHDTVNGTTNGSRVYIVYDHDKSYPAYIITYRWPPTTARVANLPPSVPVSMKQLLTGPALAGATGTS